MDQRMFAPHKRKRARLEEKKKLPPEDRELLEQKIGALHLDLQRIEKTSVVPLRRERDSKGIEVVVLQLAQPSAEQILEYHAKSSAMVQSFPKDSSPALAKVTRAEVEAVLDDYTRFPLPIHVLSLGVESGFFQVKYAKNFSDVEKGQYFALSSEDVGEFQGDIRNNKEMLLRYGYLFGLDGAEEESQSAK